MGALLLSVTTLAGAEAATDGFDLQCPLEPGRSSFHLKVGNRKREVVVEVGSQAGKDGPAPVVFFWHGWGGNPRGYLNWLGVARDWPEAVFIAPQGLPRRFPGSSRSLPGWQAYAAEHDGRDLALFDALVANLKKLPCLDAQRFLSSGFSNGGMFSNLLGCRRSDALAAIAPVGGRGPNSYDICEAPVATWVAHGSSDRIVPPAAGRASFARWQKHNGCEIEEPGSDGCFEAKNCRRDVVLCMYEGGHTWPSKLTPDWKRFLENQRLSALKKP